MWEEVAELKTYYLNSGKYEQAKECEELLTLFRQMKLVESEWKRFKQLAEQNRLLKLYGEIILF
jgi:hypothetical protein